MLYKIEYYVPESHHEQVKSALFAAGAGRVGQYDHCCWQTLGNGQYRPLPGSTPFQGDEGRVETAPEYKVEMVCEEACLQSVIDALLQAHPYQEVAYFVMKFDGP